MMAHFQAGAQQEITIEKATFPKADVSSGLNPSGRFEGVVGKGDIPLEAATDPLDWQTTGLEDEKKDVDDFEVLGLMRTTSRINQDGTAGRRESTIDDHISSIPEYDHRTYKRFSTSESKQETPSIKNSDDSSKTHQKHDSANPGDDFTVLGKLSLTASETPKSPAQRYSRAEDETVLSPRLMRHISSIPTHDYDSEDEGEDAMDDEPSTRDTLSKIEKTDSGKALSPTDEDNFEVPGLMRITSKEDDRRGRTRRSPTINKTKKNHKGLGSGLERSRQKKPGLEHHISTIPLHDESSSGDEEMVMSQQLSRTIRGIPVHDFDSEEEGAWPSHRRGLQEIV